MFAKFPRKRYAVILADPPWHFATWSRKGRDRSPDKHYSTLTMPELAELPLQRVAQDDCALFLWITWPMMIDAIILMHRWGFTYKTCAFCWAKVLNTRAQIGTGYWTRANSEVCLLATRGAPKRKHADVSQLIIEPRREHSRKPDCVHERIERLVDGPYLELFARRRRNGWSSWGNQL